MYFACIEVKSSRLGWLLVDRGWDVGMDQDNKMRKMDLRLKEHSLRGRFGDA